MARKANPDEQRFKVDRSDNLGIYVVDMQTGEIKLWGIATTEQAIKRRNEFEAAEARKGER